MKPHRFLLSAAFPLLVLSAACTEVNPFADSGPCDSGRCSESDSRATAAGELTEDTRTGTDTSDGEGASGNPLSSGTTSDDPATSRGDTTGNGVAETTGRSDGTIGDSDNSTTRGEVAACGDGRADPGELCLPINPATYAVGAGARHIAVGLLTANVGVVTANRDSGTLSILIGDGVGGFSAPVSRPAGSSGDSLGVVRLGDLEGDGDVDIVVRDYGQIRWFLNNGSGMFSRDAETIDFSGGPLDMMVLANFDADPALDVVVNNSYEVCFMRGSGGPSGAYSMRSDGCIAVFQPQFGVGTEFGFDGDGFRDLFLTQSYDYVVPARGNGDGTFMGDFSDSGGVFASACANCILNGLAAGDVDGDGQIEMIASHEEGISLRRGSPDGTFGTPTLLVANDPYEIWVGDLDGDGNTDIVAADRLDESLLVYLGDGSGALADPLAFPVGAETVSVAVADIDNNGALDLLTAHGDEATGTVAVFLSDS